MKKYIYLDGRQEDTAVAHITFPTGEKHIRITGLTWDDDVVLIYNDPTGDVMKLGLAVDICNRAHVKSISLVMPFVPYARQDRVATDGDPFSIRVFSDFVNSLGFDRIYITDPHSDVTPACLKNAIVIPQHKSAMHAATTLAGHSIQPIALVAPDLGAAKKIKLLQTYLKVNYERDLPVIQCDKTRNVTTGKITGFKILDGDPSGYHCLMVDDICDGGGTFVGLAEVIKDAGCTDQSLYITHGIFSQGVKHLLGIFNNIYTTNSFPKQEGTHIIRLVTSANKPFYYLP